MLLINISWDSRVESNRYKSNLFKSIQFDDMSFHKHFHWPFQMHGKKNRKKWGKKRLTWRVRKHNRTAFYEQQYDDNDNDLHVTNANRRKITLLVLMANTWNCTCSIIQNAKLQTNCINKNVMFFSSCTLLHLKWINALQRFAVNFDEVGRFTPRVYLAQSKPVNP